MCTTFGFVTSEQIGIALATLLPGSDIDCGVGVRGSIIFGVWLFSENLERKMINLHVMKPKYR